MDINCNETITVSLLSYLLLIMQCAGMYCTCAIDAPRPPFSTWLPPPPDFKLIVRDVVA